MAQSFIRGPFQKLDSSDEKRVEPATHIHLVGREAVSPVPFGAFGQVTKRASRDPELFEIWDKRAALSRCESSSNAPHINKVAALVISDKE